MAQRSNAKSKATSPRWARESKRRRVPSVSCVARMSELERVCLISVPKCALAAYGRYGTSIPYISGRRLRRFVTGDLRRFPSAQENPARGSKACRGPAAPDPFARSDPASGTQISRSRRCTFSAHRLRNRIFATGSLRGLALVCNLYRTSRARLSQSDPCESTLILPVGPVGKCRVGPYLCVTPKTQRYLNSHL